MKNRCRRRVCPAAILFLLGFFGLWLPSVGNGQQPPANFVVLSFDISGSMTYTFIPREVHDRIQEYLRIILFSGWRNRSPGTGDVFTIPPGTEAFSFPLLSKGSGCSILHFGSSLRVIKEVDDVSGSTISASNLFYPKDFLDNTTDMRSLLVKVGGYATAEVSSGRPCYWIFVSDNIENLSGVGGGDTNEVFQQFTSRFHYKPVFVLKISAGRNNHLGNPAFAFITIARVLDVRRQVLRFGPIIEDLESQLKELGKDENVARHKSFIELSGRIDTLKSDVRAINNSVERLSAVQEKIATIRIELVALKAIKGLWQDLAECKKQLEAIATNDTNNLIASQVVPISEKISSLESGFADTNTPQIEKKLTEIKIDIAKLTGQSELGIHLDTRTLEELERRHQALSRKNPVEPHAGQLADIGNELKELRKGFEATAPGDRKTRLEAIAKKLDAIEAAIDQEGQFKPFFERLAVIKRNIQALERNAVPAWAVVLKPLREKAEEYEKNLATYPLAEIPKKLDDLEAAVDRERQYGPFYERLVTILKNIAALEPEVAPAGAIALKGLRDKAEEYEKNLSTYPVKDIPPLLDDLETALARIPRGTKGLGAVLALLGVAGVGLLCWWVARVLTRKAVPIKVRLVQMVDGVEKEPREYLLSTNSNECSIAFTGDPHDLRAYPIDAPNYRIIKTRSSVALKVRHDERSLELGQMFEIMDELEEKTYVMLLTTIDSNPDATSPDGFGEPGTSLGDDPQ